MMFMTETEERLQLLEKRAKRCCCKYCGGELEVKIISIGKISEANMELYCPCCDKIEYGVEPQIYQDALYFVDYMQFQYYESFGNPAETRKLNVAKICEILAWHDNRLGFLGEDGYKFDIDQKDDFFIDADGSIVIKGEVIDE